MRIPNSEPSHNAGHQYRERGSMEFSGPSGGPITLSPGDPRLAKLTDEELATAIQIARKIEGDCDLFPAADGRCVATGYDQGNLEAAEDVLNVLSYPRLLQDCHVVVVWAQTTVRRLRWSS